LTNGTDYYYKIFAYDDYINYASGDGTGPHTPSLPVLNQSHVRWRNDDGGEAAASGTVAVEDSAYSTTTSATLTISSFTVQGTDRLMMVGVSLKDDNYEYVTGITWNGTETFTLLTPDRDLVLKESYGHHRQCCCLL
jgi:hypothetical protein